MKKKKHNPFCFVGLIQLIDLGTVLYCEDCPFKNDCKHKKGLDHEKKDRSI